jgi:phytoene dehydrogenase-like protein
MSAFPNIHCDDLVIGSGPAGLTTAILLAKSRRKVLLVERGAAVGGGLRGFSRAGVHFDTGFHFTGSIRPGELFPFLLRQLAVDQRVKLIAGDDSCTHRFVFSSAGNAEIHVPAGIEATIELWSSYFPKEAEAIRWYFTTLKTIASKTMGMQPDEPLVEYGRLDEDYVSLKEVLDTKFHDPVLKGAASVFAMCHGTPPAKVPFGVHARVSYGLHQSNGVVEGGGSALADALLEEALQCGVEIITGCAVESFQRLEQNIATEATLSNGRVVTFQRCVMTQHPFQILQLMHPFKLHKAFTERVEMLEPTSGYFAGFGIVQGDAPVPGFAHSIHSLFPDTDFDKMMDASWQGDGPLVLIEVPAGHGSVAPSVSALELSFAHEVKAWEGTSLWKRPKEYHAYKKARLTRVAQRLKEMVPYSDRMKWVDSASLLTFRDYLQSPEGSAYGVMQKIGQYGLFGRLPIRNLYAAGQSAFVPGVMGSMLSGFFVVRQMIGKELFDSHFWKSGKG